MIANKQYVIAMRSGRNVWIDARQREILAAALTAGQRNMFLTVGDELVNTADLEGVYSAAAEADHTRRKNGQWQCRRGEWHERATKCDCRDNTIDPVLAARLEATRKKMQS